MKTDERTSILGVIIARLSPADIAHKENRLLIATRIEDMLRQNSWSRQHFAGLMRKEISLIRSWLGSTYDLTAEALTEICLLLNVSLGDLVAE
jgi:DNA-binding Xre family transcriptional regulator